jgi:hypothetical protein
MIYVLRHREDRSGCCYEPRLHGIGASRSSTAYGSSPTGPHCAIVTIGSLMFTQRGRVCARAALRRLVSQAVHTARRTGRLAADRRAARSVAEAPGRRARAAGRRRSRRGISPDLPMSRDVPSLSGASPCRPFPSIVRRGVDALSPIFGFMEAGVGGGGEQIVVATDAIERTARLSPRSRPAHVAQVARRPNEPAHVVALRAPTTGGGGGCRRHDRLTRDETCGGLVANQLVGGHDKPPRVSIAARTWTAARSRPTAPRGPDGRAVRCSPRAGGTRTMHASRAGLSSARTRTVFEPIEIQRDAAVRPAPA